MNEFTHTEDPQQTATGAPTRTAMTRPLTEAPLAWTLPPPVAPVTPAARPRKRPAVFSGLLAAMLLLGMLLGGAGAQVTNLMVGQATPAAAAVVAPADTGSTVQMIAADSALTIGGLYKQVAPSVVLIEVTATTSAGRRSMVSQASGSGIVLDTQGDVLTNYHVVAGATSITVRAGTDGPYTATVVRTAATQDLAVVRVNSGADQLVPATFGDSSTVQVGDQVLAIGYPYDLGETLTAGIVSGLDRSQSAASSGAALSGLIQVDAAINPGNSGGALVDAQGQVIGINTMIESPVEGFTGVGLAIPINQVRPLITQLAAGGTVQ